MRHLLSLITAFLTTVISITSCHSPEANPHGDPEAADSGKIIVAYVTSWSDVIPDPAAMTHINYAFGHVSDSFDKVRISNPDRLAEIAALKQVNPDLKVLLSIGGWGSGRFSEMAADSALRSSFAADCKRVIDQYGMDGIDIDWEYPGTGVAGISSSENDRGNYTLLMRDIRRSIGPDALLTLASAASDRHIDFPAVLPYIDFVNIMTYDLDNPPYHHSPLFFGKISPQTTTDSAVKAHLAAGVPSSMLVVGMPFYGRGVDPFGNPCDYKDISLPEGYTLEWDSIAQATYIADSQGNLAIGFDDPRSIEAKCDYILRNGLRGAMYWDYAGDDSLGTLRTTISRSLNPTH